MITEIVTATEFTIASEPLFRLDTNPETSTIAEEPPTKQITLLRETLTPIIDIFENPIFFDSIESLKLVEVARFLQEHQHVTKAQWRLNISDEEFIFKFQERLDQDNQILLAEITWGLAKDEQEQFQEFIESEDVHKVVLQETKQQVYVESKTDLHESFEVIKGSEVKVSGYNIRQVDGVLQAEFAGKWYSFDSIVQQDSDMYLLLPQITEAINNGQTAFTVTTEGVSPATSKKLEIKEPAAKYIINIFDSTTNRVYNYVLIDKTIQDLQEILAKYAIVLNPENPDLTFGTVTGFDKSKFESENFGTGTIDSNEVNISLPQFNLGESDLAVHTPIFFTNIEKVDKHPIENKDIITLRNLQESDIEPIKIPKLEEEVNIFDNEPTDPKPKITEGLILIIDNPPQENRLELTDRFSVVSEVKEQGIKQEEKQTAWQVFDVGTEFEAEVVQVQEIVEQETQLEIIESSPQGRTIIQNSASESRSNETESSLQGRTIIQNSARESKSDETESFLLAPIYAGMQASPLQSNNNYSSRESRSNETESFLLAPTYAGMQASPLQSNNNYFPSESRSNESKHTESLHAKADFSFTYPHTMTYAKAKRLRTLIQEQTGRVVLELKFDKSGKLQAITR